MRPVRLAGARTATMTPSVGSGWDAPSGMDINVIGWSNPSGLSLRPAWEPVWTASEPAAAPVNTTVFAPKISVPTNISTPVSTATTTAVSPVLNVAAGSQGVSQGASTGQTATPTVSNATPQGNTVTPVQPVQPAGISQEYMQQMLEQQAREQAALRDREITLARREEQAAAAERLASEREKMAAAREAEKSAIVAVDAMQRPAIDARQDAPVPVPTPAVVPVEPTTATVPAGHAPDNQVKTGLLIALAGIAVFALAGNDRRRTRKRAAKR